MFSYPIFLIAIDVPLFGMRRKSAPALYFRKRNPEYFVAGGQIDPFILTLSAQFQTKQPRSKT